MNETDIKKRTLEKILAGVLGVGLGFPLLFLIDYYIGVVLYRPETVAMEHIRLLLVRLVLATLSVLNVIVPTLANWIEAFSVDSPKKRDISQVKHINMASSTLVVIEAASITAFMLYLGQNFSNILKNSMDFLLSAPYPTIMISGVLLVLDYLLVLVVLLLSCFRAYSLSLWLLDKVKYKHNKFQLPEFLLTFMVRLTSMLIVTVVVNHMMTFSGEYKIAVEKIFGNTIILLFLAGLHFVPFYITSRKTIT